MKCLLFAFQAQKAEGGISNNKDNAVNESRNVIEVSNRLLEDRSIGYL